MDSKRPPMRSTRIVRYASKLPMIGARNSTMHRSRGPVRATSRATKSYDKITACGLSITHSREVFLNYRRSASVFVFLILVLSALLAISTPGRAVETVEWGFGHPYFHLGWASQDGGPEGVPYDSSFQPLSGAGAFTAYSYSIDKSTTSGHFTDEAAIYIGNGQKPMMFFGLTASTSAVPGGVSRHDNGEVNTWPFWIQRNQFSNGPYPHEIGYEYDVSGSGRFDTTIDMSLMRYKMNVYPPQTINIACMHHEYGMHKEVDGTVTIDDWGWTAIEGGPNELLFDYDRPRGSGFSDKLAFSLPDDFIDYWHEIWLFIRIHVNVYTHLGSPPQPSDDGYSECQLVFDPYIRSLSSDCNVLELNQIGGIYTPYDDTPIDIDGDGYSTGVDFDDHDPTIHPGAVDIWDGKDNDFDGVVDNLYKEVALEPIGFPSTWYAPGGLDYCSSFGWDEPPEGRWNLTVGTYFDPNSGLPRGFLWSPEVGGLKNLGVFSQDDHYSTAIGVNLCGMVVGMSSSSQDRSGHAWIIMPEDSDGDSIPDTWFHDVHGDETNDLMQELFSWTLSDGTFGTVEAISQTGHVVGSFRSLNHQVAVEHAFIINPLDSDGDSVVDTWYTDDDSDGMNDLITDLGGLYPPDPMYPWDPGARSRALDVNYFGLVVGWSYAHFDTPVAYYTTRAFVVDPKDTDLDGLGDLWYLDDDGNGVNDLMIDLGSLSTDWDDDWSEAVAINEWGMIVGNQPWRDAFVVCPTMTWDGVSRIDYVWYKDDNEDGINDRMQGLGTWFPTAIRGLSFATDIEDWRFRIVGYVPTLDRGDVAYVITPILIPGDSLPYDGSIWNKDENGDGLNDLMVEIKTSAPAIPLRIDMTGLVIGYKTLLGGTWFPVIWNGPTLVHEGTDVWAYDYDMTTGLECYVGFDTMTEGGYVELAISDNANPPPFGYRLGEPPVYFSIETTCAYTGTICIRFHYWGITFEDESRLKLFHYVDGQWLPVEIAWINPWEDWIEVYVQSLSVFALLEQLDGEGPTTSNAVATPNPVSTGTDIVLTATVSDSTTGDSGIWCVQYDVDGVSAWMGSADGAFGEVTEDATITIPAFSSTGVHTITVRGKDMAGNLGPEQIVILVVYDPTAGFVTGAGWINSPAGAYAEDPLLAGKAIFGFVSKYQKGATVPSGSTEFQFKTGSLNFHSSTYEWLVVSGGKAMYKGTGTINGQGHYGFMLTAIDGNYKGGVAPDMVRIKIWDIDNGNAIIYDNLMGATDGTNPTTALEGGQIMIHK